MPKLVCTCGNTIDLSRIPVPEEWSYLKSERWDEVVEAVTAAVLKRGSVDSVLTREAISDAMVGFASSFYLCATCGRLIFPDPSDGLVRDYTPLPSGSPEKEPR